MFGNYLFTLGSECWVLVMAKGEFDEVHTRVLWGVVDGVIDTRLPI